MIAGWGRDPDFDEALTWYTTARTGLGIAVRDGDWYYERSLARAEAGVRRMHQELRGFALRR